MNRRKFLKFTAIAVSTPLIMEGLPTGQAAELPAGMSMEKEMAGFIEDALIYGTGYAKTMMERARLTREMIAYGVIRRQA